MRFASLRISESCRPFRVQKIAIYAMPVFRTLGQTLRDDYVRNEMRMRGELRRLIRSAYAVALCGDARASMCWTIRGYCARVFLRYAVRLVGWPDDIVFDNLSRITGSTRISRLLALWKSGEMRFEHVEDPAELDAARQDPLSAAPAILHRGIPPKTVRKDFGRRRRRPVTNPDNLPPRYIRDGPKSAETVSDEAEAEAEQESGLRTMAEWELLLLRLARQPLVWPELGA